MYKFVTFIAIGSLLVNYILISLLAAYRRLLFKIINDQQELLKTEIEFFEELTKHANEKEKVG